MNFLEISREDNIAVVSFSRGKVNAINEAVITEFTETFASLKEHAAVKGVILTGQGSFFSFGFDVPEIHPYSPEKFALFLQSFCRMYKELFLFPKPLIAAVNGHAVAGGCILALTADCRVMVNESAKMALNEVTFGAALFAGVVEMLRFTTGNRSTQTVLLTGRMFSPQESLSLGLVDNVVPSSELLATARLEGQALAKNSGRAFAELKKLIRKPVVDAWMNREDKSIEEFVRIWYSPETREKTKAIQIKD